MGGKKIISCYNCGVQIEVGKRSSKYVLCENCKNSGIKIEIYNQRAEKRKKTFLNKFGVDNPSQLEEIKIKKRNTLLKNHGVKTPLHSEEIKEKIKKTLIKKYGVDHPSKIKLIKNKKYKKNIEKILPKIEEQLKLIDLEMLDLYTNSQTRIRFRCKKCNSVFISYWNIVQQGSSKCPNCFPSNRSKSELEISEFIKSFFDVIENTRTIIPPYELDIFIPEKNIAIEFNGLYWHSEKFVDKNYHLNKLIECQSKNIRLIQIFEDEWLFKKDIVKNRLLHIFGKNRNCLIHARKCVIKEIDAKTKNEFLEKYHIQGKDISSVRLGAFYDNELIAVMTFSHGSISKGSSKIDKNIWELNRFCNKHGYHVVGIASKLLQFFKRNYKWKEIFSYADLRWSKGDVYEKIGFECVGTTKINYWYTDGNYRFHRFNFKTTKEKKEKELIAELQYLKIWDCGNKKYILKNL